MITNVNKLPFPDFLLKTDCSIEINSSGINNDGEPNKPIIFEGKCIFSEKSKIIYTQDGQKINLVGKIIIKGDIAPSIQKIASGQVYIGHLDLSDKFVKDKKLEIYASSRPRNPDGTIHHTTLELM